MVPKLRPYLLLPHKVPKTIRSIEKWHRKLLGDCAYFEFEKKALEAGIAQIQTQIKKYIHFKEDAGYNESCKFALSKLNVLLAQWEKELSLKKAIVDSIYVTNEYIINSLLKAHGQFEDFERLIANNKSQPGNLLHEPGWLAEYEACDIEKDKYASFMTFGTPYCCAPHLASDF